MLVGRSPTFAYWDTTTLGSTEKKLRIMECSPKTCVEAGEFSDEYEQGRLQEPGQEKILTQDP